MEIKQITVLLIIIKLLIFSDMCNFFTCIFLIFYLLINSANGLRKTNYMKSFAEVSNRDIALMLGGSKYALSVR